MSDAPRISGHILPASATMLGVCITVISLVRLLEENANTWTTIDEILAANSALFLCAAFFSYLSIRSPRAREQLEALADLTFVIALVVIAAASVMLAWEIESSAISPSGPA